MKTMSLSRRAAWIVGSWIRREGQNDWKEESIVYLGADQSTIQTKQDHAVCPQPTWPTTPKMSKDFWHERRRNLILGRKDSLPSKITPRNVTSWTKTAEYSRPWVGLHNILRVKYLCYEVIHTGLEFLMLRAWHRTPGCCQCARARHRIIKARRMHTNARWMEISEYL